MADEIKAANKKLWGTESAPRQHWTNLSWSKQATLAGPEVEEAHATQLSIQAWLIHGGGAGVAGFSAEAFLGVEVNSREVVKTLVPEAYRLVAVAMKLVGAIPAFFEELDTVVERVSVYAAIDAQLQARGLPSKLSKSDTTVPS